MADDNETLERIRKRAYELWEIEGRPEGKENDHWVQATKEILDEANPKAEVTHTEDVGNPYDRMSTPDVKPE